VSNILFTNRNYTIYKKTGIINGIDLDIILTYCVSKENPQENKLIRGYLYMNKKEYEIKSSYIYCSLQIGQLAYDNIQIIQLDANIFE